MVFVLIILFCSISVSYLVFDSNTPLYLTCTLTHHYIQLQIFYSPPITSTEVLGLLIPPVFLTYFLQKPLKFLIFSNFLVSLWTSFTFSTQFPLIHFLFSLLFFQTLKSDISKMNSILSYYRKSDLLFQNIWAKSSSLNFIVDKSAQILNQNQSADEYSQSRSKTKEVKLDSVLSIHDVLNFIEKSFKNEDFETEVFQHSNLDKIGNLIGEGSSFLIKGAKIMWNGVYCVGVYSVDTSLYRARRMMVIESFRMTQFNLESFAKQVLERIKLNDSIDNETFVSFFNVNQVLRDTMVLKSRFYNKYEPRFEHFDVNSEMLNIIEILYGKACTSGVSISYTKDQGLPVSVIGDKTLHFQVIYTMISFILENSLPESRVQIYLQVYVRVKYDITLNYKFSFKSEKITNFNIDNIFNSQSYHCSKDLIEQSSYLLNTYGLGITAANSILLNLRGNIVKSESESDRNKVTINLTLPFNTGKRKVTNPQIKLSENTSQESNLTLKWTPVQQKAIKRSMSITENQHPVSLAVAQGDQISLVQAQIRAIRDLKELHQLAEGKKKMILTIGKHPESPYFYIISCDSFSKAKDLFLKYHEYRARFFAILIPSLTPEAKAFYQLIRDTEKNSYFKTLFFICQDLLI